jgi:hypothetical protein
MSDPKKCPCCESPPKEGSGGWAVDFQCGTRFGHMSKTILWRGYRCIEKTLGRQMSTEEREEHKQEVMKAMFE